MHVQIKCAFSLNMNHINLQELLRPITSEPVWIICIKYTITYYIGHPQHCWHLLRTVIKYKHYFNSNHVQIYSLPKQTFTLNKMLHTFYIHIFTNSSQTVWYVPSIQQAQQFILCWRKFQPLTISKIIWNIKTKSYEKKNCF